MTYRKAQSELESCRGKLELKEMELLELRHQLKARMDEMSEMSVRVTMAEKKLETSGRGNLEKIVDLEDRLQKMKNQQKQTEKLGLQQQLFKDLSHRHHRHCMSFLFLGNMSKPWIGCKAIY